MRQVRLTRFWPAFILLINAPLVLAEPIGTVITIDENGIGNINGTPLPFAMQPDPGPGGLNPVLTYFLPFAGLQGDVGLQDNNGVDPPGAILDYLRFNGNGTVVFYSDNIDGFDALADTPAPPSAFYPNRVIIPEIGPEGNNGAFYTPTPNQPGWDPSNPTYHFISDVPEPATALLLAVSGALLLTRRRNSAPIGSVLP